MIIKQLFFVAGLSVSILLRARSGTSSSVRGKGLLGLFAGVEIEHRFAGGPISVFGEGQYNFAWPIISSLIGNYGGANLTAGLRYYFKDSRRH